MPTKKGAGGRQQNYSSATGRYTKTNYVDIIYHKKTKKEIKEDRRILDLEQKALKSTDRYLYKVYQFLESKKRGIVTGINTKMYDKAINGYREFDITTNKCIIEVKSMKVQKCLRQFNAQLDYAKRHNKKFIVFAPDINKSRKYIYSTHNIIICTNFDQLHKEVFKK